MQGKILIKQMRIEKIQGRVEEFGRRFELHQRRSIFPYIMSFRCSQGSRDLSRKNLFENFHLKEVKLGSRKILSCTAV